MKNGTRLGLEQIKAFLQAGEEFRFEAGKREEIYDWVAKTLVEQEYSHAKRETKGLVRGCIAKMTGLSRAQATRLIGRYKQTGEVKEHIYRRNKFTRHYDAADIESLAAVDEAIQTFCEKSFNPYLNFHCPRGVPGIVQRRAHRWYATPLEILAQLPDLARYLKPDQPLVELQVRPTPTAIRKPPGKCSKPSNACLPASS